MRSTSAAIASRSGLSPRRAMRCAIQSGNSFGFNGQTGTNVPARSTAATHAVSCCLLHCVQVISSTVSGGGFSQYSMIAAAPSLPGRPPGRRRSITRRDENSDIDAAAIENSFQS